MALDIVSGDVVRRAMAHDEAAITVVDARPHDDFVRGHIPGALSLEWEQWCSTPPRNAAPVLSAPGYWGALVGAAPTWYAERLSRCGLSSERPVVVYADGERSKGREGRIAWMLLYLGARHVALLDGGWTGWREQGGVVAMGTVPVSTGHFTVRVQAQRRWTHARLAQAYREGRLPALIDTRTHAEYAGACYDYLPRKGRLPGALLFPFPSLFAGPRHYVGRETYLARRPVELKRIADGGAPGRDTHRSVVAYCEVGVRASLMALLHEVYTGEVVGVFDGSLIEWALDTALPVYGPPAP